MATGTSSTDSLDQTTPPITEEQLDQASLRQALELRENVKRLCALQGVRSLARNLKAEDEAVRRNTETAERQFFGEAYEASKAPPEDDDDMEYIAARDIIINNVPPQAVQQPSTVAAAPSQPATPGAPSAATSAGGPAVAGVAAAALPGWVKAGMVGLGMVGSAAGGAIINNASQPTISVVQPSADTDTNSTIELGD
jgi:hypothetical protein